MKNKKNDVMIRLKTYIKRPWFLLEEKFAHLIKPPYANIFIITKFNIELPKQNKNKILSQDKIFLNEEYLAKRFELFEKFYIPSLLAQTDKDFKIIVFFHPDTPDIFKSKIEEYKTKFEDRFIAIYSKNYDIEKLKNVIYDNKKSGSRIITARLDNDDALSCYFVETLRKTHTVLSDMYINFEKHVMFVEKENKYYYFACNRGHFISKVEELNSVSDTNFKSVYLKDDGTLLNHSNINATFARFLNVKNLPLCLEVVHDNNILNCKESKNTVECKDKKVIDSFVINNI